ncbi:MAG TPA: CAP-associated domain-containing protein, partial [Pseudogracilibacillus sp.]|nr:CAP-associated domain-containing protein [Pseudogracilibacillus sp.]
MKRLLKFFILIVSLLILYIVVTDERTIGLIEEIEGVENITLPKLKVSNEEKHYEVLFEGDLYEFVGKNEDEVLLELGEPIRKDITPYGYTWWIYQEEDHYLQVGVENKEVVT